MDSEAKDVRALQTKLKSLSASLEEIANSGESNIDEKKVKRSKISHTRKRNGLYCFRTI